MNAGHHFLKTPSRFLENDTDAGGLGWTTRRFTYDAQKTKVPSELVEHKQRTPHDLIAANNVDAFFERPSLKDICIGKIVTNSNGVSQFIPEPKKTTKPRKQKTKNFLGRSTGERLLR